MIRYGPGESWLERLRVRALGLCEDSGMVLDFRLGDVVRLRKPHPCGSTDWTVVRLGADIGIRCLKCEHRVLLDRSVLERRLKEFVSRGAPPADAHTLTNRSSS